MANFEMFRWNILSGINLFFSEECFIYVIYFLYNLLGPHTQLVSTEIVLTSWLLCALMIPKVLLPCLIVSKLISTSRPKSH